MNFSASSKGFTFIEVMVAMLIFVLAALAALNIVRGSVRATKEAKQMSVATWLVQGAMVDLETQIEADGFDKGCEKKKDGKFKAPHENFNWTTSCEEIDFNISQAAAKAGAALGSDKEKDRESTEDVIQKMILDSASKYLTNSLRELHVIVWWLEGKQRKEVTLTTHFGRYDQPLSLPGVGGGGGGSSSSSTTDPNAGSATSGGKK